MKKQLFPLLCAAVVLAACSDDNNDGPGFCTVDFEQARLNDAGFLWGKEMAKTLTAADAESEDFGEGSLFYYAPIYAEESVAFSSLYSDYAGLYGTAYDTWNGFVVSKQTDMETNSYSNDKSVYATSGADGSSQFAVAYYGAWTPEPYGVPTVNFSGAVKPVSVALANTTLFYLYFKNDMAPAAAVDVEAVVTGYNGTAKTGEVRVKLADASGSVKSGWENVNLSALGTVTSLTVTIATSDSMCPNYVALDNLVFER